MPSKPTETSLEWRKYLPFLWIIMASALAHLWCLGSQFYMDDASQIRDSEIVRTGNFAAANITAWTYLGYVLQYRLFGMSAVGFHAVNWLLHTAVACVLFGFGSDFLKERWPKGVALFGALLFAVHPLASEIPNYVRTQDLAWVTLFSLLAAWALLRFLREGGWVKWLGCGVCILGATFSKGPGLFHALMMCGAVGLVSMLPVHRSMLRRKAWWIGAGLVMLISTLWLTGFHRQWSYAFHQWAEPRFIGHAYTVSRVFWEFAWRSVIPVDLSADHHIAETLIPAGASFLNIPDKVAMFAAVCFFALALLSVVLAWWKPTRLFGVCLFLYVATILFRVFYLIPEFMPEYRIYPGLPWFCLGAAIALTVVWQKITTASPRLPAAILLVTCIVLSMKRSFLWHDLDRLLADVSKQYPTQARVIWELDDRDAAAGKWQAIIDRQQNVWPQIEAEFLRENQRLSPKRELPTGHMALAAVACMGHYAVAVAHQQSPAAGLREINRLEQFMRQLGLDPKAHEIHWGYFYHRKGLVLEATGNHTAAAAVIKKAILTDARKRDLERVEKTIP